MQVRNAEPRDHTFISILVASAFGRPDEARLVEALRTTGDMVLELVAEEDGKILAHIGFSRLDSPAGWWALAPVSVINSRQRRGVGSEIIREGLDRARQAKARGILVVGSADYYNRFGFTTAAAANLRSVYPAQHLLALPIQPGSAGESGSVILPEPFAVLS